MLDTSIGGGGAGQPAPGQSTGDLGTLLGSGAPGAMVPNVNFDVQSKHYGKSQEIVDKAQEDSIEQSKEVRQDSVTYDKQTTAVKTAANNPTLPTATTARDTPPSGTTGTGNPFFGGNPMTCFFVNFFGLMQVMKEIRKLSSNLQAAQILQTKAMAKDQAAFTLAAGKKQAMGEIAQAVASGVQAGVSGVTLAKTSKTLTKAKQEYKNVLETKQNAVKADQEALAKVKNQTGDQMKSLRENITKNQKKVDDYDNTSMKLTEPDPKNVNTAKAKHEKAVEEQKAAQDQLKTEYDELGKCKDEEAQCEEFRDACSDAYEKSQDKVKEAQKKLSAAKTPGERDEAMAEVRTSREHVAKNKKALDGANQKVTEAHEKVETQREKMKGFAKNFEAKDQELTKAKTELDNAEKALVPTQTQQQKEVMGGDDARKEGDIEVEADVNKTTVKNEGEEGETGAAAEKGEPDKVAKARRDLVKDKRRLRDLENEQNKCERDLRKSERELADYGANKWQHTSQLMQSNRSYMKWKLLSEAFNAGAQSVASGAKAASAWQAAIYRAAEEYMGSLLQIQYKLLDLLVDMGKEAHTTCGDITQALVKTSDQETSSMRWSG